MHEDIEKIFKHWARPYTKDEGWDDRRAIVTSICPTCNKEWTRELWVAGLCGGTGLAMCDECRPNGKTMIGNNKYWPKNA